MTAEEFSGRLERFPRTEVEELSVQQSEASSTVFVSAQSTRNYHGNVRALIAELTKSLEAGEQLVFLFSNLGRAE